MSDSVSGDVNIPLDPPLYLRKQTDGSLILFERTPGMDSPDVIGEVSVDELRQVANPATEVSRRD